MKQRILIGDCRTRLAELADGCVQTCVTSPPYFGLRDYGHAGQMGLEATPDAYVAVMVEVFREVRRVLADDGTLWLNLGDSYASSGGPGWQGKNGQRSDRRFTGTRNTVAMREQARTAFAGVKSKDLLMMPARVALALQADGWYLRSDIIWHKPNPMPESVTDRPTKSHEYLFLLSKSERYYYDIDAIREPIAGSQVGRVRNDVIGGASHVERGQHSKGGAYRTGPRDQAWPKGWAHGDEPHGVVEFSAKVGRSGNKKRKAASARGVPVDDGGEPSGAVAGSVPWEGTTRNKRTVWTVPTMPFKGAHFATFPPALIEPCILAGSKRGDTVLDPFGGAGTTSLVADRLGRDGILCELNPAYAEMARHRLQSDGGMLTTVECVA